MLPLIPIAAALVPEIIKLIAGDKAGGLANSVAQAVSDITGTSDPVAARQKIAADSTAAIALQQKLAELTLDATKAQMAEADQQRKDELETLRASIENTAGARGTMLGLVSARSPIAYGPPIVSTVVTLGFVSILFYIVKYPPAKDIDQNVINIINIAIGLLGTAFATVVNFWLGSSSGSRNKDQQTVALQEAHDQQTNKVLSTLTSIHESNVEALKTALIAGSGSASGTSAQATPQGPATPVATAAAATVAELTTSTVPEAAMGLLNLIASREAPAGYGTLFGNNQGKLTKPLIQMTVANVIASGPEWTARFGSSACGRYQFMNATLKGLRVSEALAGSELFDPPLQDRLGYALLDRRGYESFLRATMTQIAFGLGLAKEWASFPVLEDCQGAHGQVQRGQSFYAGDGLNRALITPEQVEAALDAIRHAASMS